MGVARGATHGTPQLTSLTPYLFLGVWDGIRSRPPLDPRVPGMVQAGSYCTLLQGGHVMFLPRGARGLRSYGIDILHPGDRTCAEAAGRSRGSRSDLVFRNDLLGGIRLTDFRVCLHALEEQPLGLAGDGMQY